MAAAVSKLELVLIYELESEGQIYHKSLVVVVDVVVVVVVASTLGDMK